MTAHDYRAANLGHASQFCRHCGGTPNENAALGQPIECSSAPEIPAGPRIQRKQGEGPEAVEMDEAAKLQRSRALGTTF